MQITSEPKITLIGETGTLPSAKAIAEERVGWLFLYIVVKPLPCFTCTCGFNGRVKRENCNCCLTNCHHMGINPCGDKIC